MGLNACESRRRSYTPNPLVFEEKSLPVETIINSAVYYNGHIFCLQADGKIFVLDTFFKKDSSLTTKFLDLSADFMFPYNDTIFIGIDKDTFFLDRNLNPKKYQFNPFTYRSFYYSDDTYYVYACSAGEWGASVYFWNRKTGKTYSYPTTGVQQVFEFRGIYVVSNYLNHLGGHSDYLFIKDPSKIYELQSESQKTFCNWYLDIDSIGDSDLYSSNESLGVIYYSDSFTTRPVTTFPYNSEIYSIYSTDSATILARFEKGQLRALDTLIHREQKFHTVETQLTDSVLLASFKATWIMADNENKRKVYYNSGLFFRKNNKITFLEFQRPNQRTDNSR